MPKFCNKPVVIEAFRWMGEPIGEGDPPWIVKAVREKDAEVAPPEGLAHGWRVLIDAYDGVGEALPGDWIIRGVKGDLSTMEDDTFRETYEPVDDPSMEDPPVDDASKPVHYPDTPPIITPEQMEKADALYWVTGLNFQFTFLDREVAVRYASEASAFYSIPGIPKLVVARRGQPPEEISY